MTAIRRCGPRWLIGRCCSRLCKITIMRIICPLTRVLPQAKRKYQEVAQMRKELEQDNQELQQKYQQKAMCAPCTAGVQLGLMLHWSKLACVAPSK